MTLNVDYSFSPVRARPGMAYGQYNQITTFSTTGEGVTPGAVVTFSGGAVTNGGAIPAGVVVDSQSLLGLGFDDQYKDSCCAVLEQGKVWVLTAEDSTFAINDPVAYDPATGEMQADGTVIDGWTVVGATHDGAGRRTLVQVLPLRKTVAPEEQAAEAPASQSASITVSQPEKPENVKSTTDSDAKNKK